MHHIRRIILTAALAATTLLAITSAASARRLAVDDQDFEVRWTPLVLLKSGGTTSCNVTLLGSFHSLTINKSIGSLIGYIDHASLASCATFAFLTTTLPWHVTYGGFAGTLPSISSITLNVVGLSVMFTACLAITEVAEPFRAISNLNGSGQITGLTADPTASIDLNDMFRCIIGGDLEFEGTGLVEDLAGNLLFIRLVR